VPSPHPSAVRASCLAALDIMEISNIITRELARRGPTWGIRIGLHAGPVLAGVIGKTKFSYDVWGATVNLASRMETASLAGRINVSRAVHDSVSEEFEWEPRGWQDVKHLGDVEMFFLVCATCRNSGLRYLRAKKAYLPTQFLKERHNQRS
jgi:adenylate cyclase